MNHPHHSELLEYGRGLLSGDRAREIEDHLARCDECRQEVEGMRAVGEKLDLWPAIEVPDEYVDAQLRVLDRRLSTGETGRSRRVLDRIPLLSSAAVRGVVIAATAVISTIAVQGLILTPMAMQREIRTVFEMAPLPMEYPAAGVMPDTMIVLNVHPDGSYSTSVFEGLYSFDALKVQLAREVPRGEYWTMAVNATEARSPFRLAFKDLVFFKKRLGINEFRFWTDDVVSRLARRNLTLEELQQIIGAGQPRIEVTQQGIDIEAMHEVSLTIGTDGRINLYGHDLTMAEMSTLLRNYHTLNPGGGLRIRYWAGSAADSVLTAVKSLATEVGIETINESRLGER